VIAELAGVVSSRSPEYIVIDVHGVGYLVSMSLNAYYQLPDPGRPVKLLIHTHVREDTLQLFGFLDAEEKGLFLLLIGVSGIGPKLALNILSGRPSQELLEAIESGDLARLVAIPGVGKKTAERIVLELRDKVKAQARSTPAGALRAVTGVEDEAVSALINLGYKRPDAERAVKAAVKSGAPDFEAIIRTTLRELS